LGSATDQAEVDACTLYWFLGSNPQPSWGIYDPIRNAIFWSAAVNNSSTANRVLKYDLNLREWYPFDLGAGAFRIRDSNLYFGSSTGGYWNKYGSVDNDNGSAITAYWKSKDFGGNDPFSEKTFQAISVVARNQGSGNLTTTYTTSGGTGSSYSISLSTSSGLSYIRSNRSLGLLSPQTFMNVKFSDSSANNPFEVLGFRIDFFSQPWRPISQ
jgi:hypothetical protein